MNYEGEFRALADLAMRANLITPEQIALVKRTGTRKSVYGKRHLLDLMAFLRGKVKRMTNEEIDQMPLAQLVVETVDAIEEAWGESG